MKKLFIYILLCFIPLLLYSNENKKVYKVVVLEKWKPYYFLTENLKPTGFGVELFEAVAAESNIKIEYVVKKTAKEVLDVLENKQVQIIPSIGYSTKRKSYLNYSHFTDTSRLLLYKRSKSDRINDIKDTKFVAVVYKNVAQRVIKKNYPNIKLKVYPDHFTALRALLSGEVDAFSYPEPIMKYTLKNLNIEDKIVPFYKSLSETKRAIGVIKGEEELLKSLNNSLNKIKENGTYDKLYLKWFEKEKKFEVSKNELILFSIALIFLIAFIIWGIIFISLRNKWFITKEVMKKEIINQKMKIESQNKIILSQSKNVAIGEMLGNIAHQWRQPLNVISISIGSMRLSLELHKNLNPEELKKYIDNISNQVEYLSDTIDNFRSFFSSQVDTPKVVDLKGSILKLNDLIKDAFKNNNINIILDLYESKVLLKESALIQSLINICNNSKDAMVLSNINESDRFLFISTKEVNKNIIIEIQDSAGGISEDIIDKIFEPYFTTKFESQGTGLGLYISHQIITTHLEGQVVVDNVEYEYEGKKLKGAKFVITLSIETKP